MKLGLYADPHYAQREMSGTKRYNRRSLQKIKDAYKTFAENGVELAICLGDLIDNDVSREVEKENLKELGEVIRLSGVPTVCVMGNHDAFALTEKDYYACLGGCEPKDIHTEKNDLIFLDACFFKSGAHYAPGDSDWRDTFLPDTDALKKTLENCKGDVYVFMHQNLDPGVTEEHRLFNAAEVIDILEKSGKIKTVFQGHYHPGHRTALNGIEYISLPAMCEVDDGAMLYEI